MNPPAQPLPYERAVTCECDRTFHLPLAFLISPGFDPAHACVRCGRISCTEVLWTHVHHNTYDPHGRQEYPVTEEIRAWLDLWPRVLTGATSGHYAFLSATTRCTDVTDFQLQSSRAFASAKSRPPGRRLREAGIPSAPPPENLPEPLKNYGTFWELGQRLTPGCDAALLLNNARSMYRLSSAFAIDALLQRADLPDILARASASPENEDRETIFAIVREDPATLPLILPSLLAWLAQAADRLGTNFNDHHLASLLDFFAAQKSAAVQIVPVLEAVKARVSRHAFEFSRKITETIRTLNGEPPLPISSKPWFFN